MHVLACCVHVHAHAGVWLLAQACALSVISEPLPTFPSPLPRRVLVPRAPAMGELEAFMRLKEDKLRRKNGCAILTPTALTPQLAQEGKLTLTPRGSSAAGSDGKLILTPRGSSEAGWLGRETHSDDGGNSDSAASGASDGLVTNASSKMSNSRPANQRGPKRKKRNHENLRTRGGWIQTSSAGTGTMS